MSSDAAIPPSEHVLGIVCGLPELHRSNRWLVMLKAYIDDSRMRQPPFYVLGGWFAPVHVWTKFSDAWRDILWMSPRIEYFKYEEATNFTGQFHGISEEKRNEKVRLLVNLIEEHQMQGISSVIPHNIYAALFADMDHKSARNPYFLSFFGISALLFGVLSQLQSQEKAEIIFDYQPGSDSMGEVQSGWEDFRSLAPPDLLRYVQIHPPTFLSDKDVVALQAADLHAGWSRYQIECLDSWKMPVPLWYPSGEKIRTHTRTWDAPSLVDIFESAFAVRPMLGSYTLKHGLNRPSDVSFLRFL
jgi:hypothetical protein